MTARVRNITKCKGCGNPLVCECGKPHNCFTPFSDYIRLKVDDSHTYDVQNLDFIRFNYRQGWLITMEEKRMNGSSSQAQSDTHKIVEQMLKYASGKSFNTMRGLRPIEYRGHFVVAFEKTNPEDSALVRINGKEYREVDMRVRQLLTSGDPRTQAEKDSDDWQVDTLNTREGDRPL